MVPLSVNTGVHRRGAKYAERASRPLPLELTEVSEVFFWPVFLRRKNQANCSVPEGGTIFILRLESFSKGFMRLGNDDPPRSGMTGLVDFASHKIH
jgi:hypothetical protein